MQISTVPKVPSVIFGIGRLCRSAAKIPHLKTATAGGDYQMVIIDREIPARIIWM